MNRPELKSISITPDVVGTKGNVKIQVSAEDVLIVFGTDYKYARTGNYELHAGEEGLI